MADRRRRGPPSQIDLVSLALLALCYALVEGQRYNWGTIGGFVSIPLIAGAGVVLLALFIIDQAVRQRGENEPLIPFALFRSRNYTLMNVVSCAVSIGMLGLFLPLTIYLQSALGYSALKAGLALMPASLVMIFLAPGLGKLTDRIGGRYILISGLALFAIGMGWLVAVAGPRSSWYDLLAPLIVIGTGMGGTFVPLTTTAMREVGPGLTGAASGVLNTTRQVGSVIGAAAVGALLQNRLVASLGSEAAARAGVLPPAARGPFVSGFRQAASTGLVGGPASSAARVPPGTPAALAAEVRRLAAEVFTNGYVPAMRWTMVLPIAVVGLAAVPCFGVRRVAAGTPGAAGPPDAEAIQLTGAGGSPGRRRELGP